MAYYHFVFQFRYVIVLLLALFVALIIIDDNVKLFEVQDIYKKYSGDKNPMGLKKLAQSLEIDISHLAAHKSSDDAEITMLVAKCLLKKLDINARNIRKYISKADKYM